ncbi:MAG: hypothetical protein WCC25_08720 [Candidatus Korobacteraceae bacterium]
MTRDVGAGTASAKDSYQGTNLLVPIRAHLILSRLQPAARFFCSALLAFCFVFPLTLSGSDTEVPSCPKDPRVIAACYTVHGRLNNWNGNPTRRIWIVGTKRMLGLRDGTELPVALQKPLSDFDHEVYGDFEFCPFTPEKPGVMQVGCLAAVSNYQIKTKEQH